MNAEELARRIEAEAAVAARPGQLDSLEQIAREVRALAGAPTADVAAMRVRLDEALSSYYGSLTQSAIDDIIAKTFAATPEGVDAADGRCGCADAEATYAQLEGDYERQAVELTAAQAAIQRVRELHFATEPGEWICEECSQDSPCPTVRALDGGTTEGS